MSEQIRKTGIEIIGDIPWGTHFCQFYQTKDDLTDILVPYFKAGLENNEFCMWITSEPLGAEEAQKALSKVIPDFKSYIDQGQIEILPYDEWYVIDGIFDTNRILESWISRLKKAQKNGFDGLRLTGNTFWLENKDWDDFVHYEEAIDKVIGSYQMIAMCTYSLDKCNASEIIDVVNNHEFALIKREGNWTLLANKQKETEEALKKSEENYYSLYSTMSEGVAIHEIIYENNSPVDYIITDINLAYEDIVGLKRDDVIGKKASQLYRTGEAPYLDIYSKVAQSGHPYSFETYFEPMNKYFRIIVTSPDEGKFATFFEDITKRKSVEAYEQEMLEKEYKLTDELKTANEELQHQEADLSSINQDLLKSEAQFQVLIQNVYSGVALIDETGKFVVVNPAFLQMFGLDNEMDIFNINSQDWDLWKVYDENKKLLHVDEHPVRKVAITGKDVKNQLVSVKNPGDDKLTYMLISAHPLLNKDGSIHMIICTYYDITKRKRFEEELKISNQELTNIKSALEETVRKLELSNTELEQFAYVASHDLQEPLRMVASFTQLLERRYKSQIDEEADEYINFIVEGAQRMKNLINDLLTYSRLNKKTKDFKKTDLNITLNEVLTILNSSIEENNVKITHNQLPTVTADSSQMRQLFQNLISNAIKFRGETPPKIHINAEESFNCSKICVTDNGIGIGPENQEKIFQVFKRLHTMDEYQGTGIGLSICKRIVERHDGEIWVESEEGKGSKFYFTISKKEQLIHNLIELF